MPKAASGSHDYFAPAMRLLLDAIAALPVQCRHVFLLRKIDALSYAQIADKLAISEKTVQRHPVKAMLHCHRRLGLVPA
jgi:RNA polymerase sigma factor (sigma-70 family)